MANEEKDFFKELGLQLSQGEVSKGGTYPIFGMITKIVDETPGNVAVEINNQMIIRFYLHDPSGIATIKSRLFETGVFVSKVTETEPVVIAQCETVIFGKKQPLHS